MLKKIKAYFLEPKPRIGFGRGIFIVITSMILSYITMMLYAKFMVGDVGVKIVPAMIITPLCWVGYAFWLLFSKTFKHCIEKFSFVFIILLFFLKVI